MPGNAKGNIFLHDDMPARQAAAAADTGKSAGKRLSAGPKPRRRLGFFSSSV